MFANTTGVACAPTWIIALVGTRLRAAGAWLTYGRNRYKQQYVSQLQKSKAALAAARSC
jgi:hypothetical protein